MTSTMTSKKRSAVQASPMTRMTQELGDALTEAEGPSSAGDNLPSSQNYCTPEYFSGDYCTPDDQVQDLNYSQREDDPSSQPSKWICPPTPESSKRRKKVTAKQPAFMYDFNDLEAVTEGHETEDFEALPVHPLQQPTPGKRSMAPAKPQKQRTLQESWMSLSSGSGSSSSKVLAASGSGRTSVGAKACNANPFVRNLTAKEMRTPSRAMPVLESAVRPSRYMQDFEELELLGKGDFGQVYMVRSRIDGCAYAVKRGRLALRKSNDKNSAYYEVFAMSYLAGVSNAVRYHSSWVEEEELYIQMELCQGTLLKQCGKRGRLSEADALEVLEQISTALQGMHSVGMAHMDVKAENIYVAVGGGYRLGDFGLAASEEMLAKGVEPLEGDGRYAAPEAVMGLSQGLCHSLTPCDVYSLGACVLELCLGMPIDWNANPYQAVREGHGAVEITGFDARTCLLLTSMLALDPLERCSASDVKCMAQSLHGTGSTEDKLRAELMREREKRVELERQVAALSHTPNQSVDRVNDSMEGSEPMGSQESPFRSGQPIPPSPIPQPKIRGKGNFFGFTAMLPPSPQGTFASPCAPGP